jgi:hypothetical protein
VHDPPVESLATNDNLLSRKKAHVKARWFRKTPGGLFIALT